MDQCPYPPTVASSLVPTRSAPWEDALLAQAERDLVAGRHEAALQRAWSVLGRLPDQPQALALLGRVALHREQPDAALEPLRRAARLRPRPDARIWLALCLHLTGRRDEALREVEAAAASL